MHLTELARKTLKGLGLHFCLVNRSSLFLQGHLNRLFSRLGVNCVIDVGANEGQYGVFLRKMGYTGVILSFEPLIEAFLLLEEKAKKDGQWKAYNFALGDKNEERLLKVMTSSDFSTFLEPNEELRRRWAGVTIKEARKVMIRRLDEVLREVYPECTQSKIFLKMDTQGYNPEVFKGAEKILDCIYGIQTEISMIPIYKDIPDVGSQLAPFNETGFSVTGFYPISRDTNGLSVIEFDCVMTKQA